jgi:hypothetical protein
MKQFLIILTFVFATHVASADGGPVKSGKAEVEGKVLDAENAEGLTGALVRINELDLEVYASFDGSFNFGEIPAGIYTVEVSYIGHPKMVYESCEINSGKAFKKFFL